MFKLAVFLAVVACAFAAPKPGFLHEPVVAAHPVAYAQHVPVATSYSNTYKVSHKSPVVSYSAPLAYAAAPAVVAHASPVLAHAHPVAYSAPVAHHVAYSAPVAHHVHAAPVAYAAHAW